MMFRATAPLMAPRVDRGPGRRPITGYVTKDEVFEWIGPGPFNKDCLEPIDDEAKAALSGQRKPALKVLEPVLEVKDLASVPTEPAVVRDITPRPKRKGWPKGKPRGPKSKPPVSLLHEPTPSEG